MAASITDRIDITGRDRAGGTWWRALVRPTVLAEFLFGVSPLVAMAYWGWDVVLVLILYLLGLAVSAAFLVLRTATLSDHAVSHFNTKAQLRSLWQMRLAMVVLTLFALAAPLGIMVALLIAMPGDPWVQSVGNLGDFWRAIVVGSGLWVPLAFVFGWEATSFVTDVLLPRIPFKPHLQAPLRPIHSGYSKLSRELQAFLFVRAWVVVRMLIMVFGVPIGLILARSVGVVAVVAMLVLLKTAVAVLIEIANVADAENRQARMLRRRFDLSRTQ